MGRALITGISGQDGWYLAHYLHLLGEDVVGLSRTGKPIEGLPFVHTFGADITDDHAILQVLRDVRATTIYHLAAQSSVAVSWDDPIGTSNITGLGTARLLEAIRATSPEARVFLASSSEVFGSPDHFPQNELTPIRPSSPYGAAKAFALHLARIYRQRYDLFVSVGLLYNHESPRRPPIFVTRKITKGAVAIASGQATELRLGNLDVIRDWGAAEDYVRAMHAILCHSEPDDFVIATGVPHSVRDWCQFAFEMVNLDYRNYVTSDPVYWRPSEPVPLVGNPEKAHALLSWKPEISLQSLVSSMIQHDQAEAGLVDRPQKNLVPQ